jgi:hypothetical protein
MSWLPRCTPRGVSALAVLAIVALLPSVVLGQYTSSVQGTVVDPTGSSVPDVELRLTNVNTGVTATARSNDAGLFRYPDLPPGKYRLQTTKTGFQTLVQENIILESGRIQSVPITLKVGAITEQVTVTEYVIPVETSNPKISSTVTNEYIQSIPLNYRNIYNVQQLAPGVTGFGLGSDSFSVNQGASVAANGMRIYSNGYYVDGAPVADMADGGMAKLTPNPDSVEEVRVSTNDYSAQWGKNAGILTQTVTKSGTNDWHGTVYEFHRNNVLTARTFLQSTVNPTLGRATPVYRRNDFGGSFGGAIKKDKAFFFVTVDKLLSGRAFANVVTVETPEYVNFLKQNYPNNVSTKLVTQFPSVITQFQPGTILTVASLTPGCAGTNSIGMPCSMPVYGNGVFSDVNGHNGLQWNARFDENFRGGKDRVYGNIFRTSYVNDGKNVRPGFSTKGYNPAGDPSTSLYVSVNETHIFSASIINEMSSSLVRDVDGGPCTNCQVPSIGITGITGFGNGWAPGVYITRDINWQDVLSVNHGKHFLKFGMTYFVNQEPLQFTAPLNRPGFSFLNVFDFATDKPISESNINFDPRTGSTKINNERDFRLAYYGFFAQDDWKVRKNLTINLGLREEFNRNPTDLAGLMTNVTMGEGSTMSERIKNMSVGPVQGLMPHIKYLNVAPRLGIAWDPTNTGKMSVRSGFGIFYDTFYTKTTFDREQLNPPYFAAGSIRSDDPTAFAKPIFVLGTSQAAPFGFTLPGAQAGLNAKGGPIGVRASVAGAQVTFPYTINWFTGVQYAFTPKWVVEVNYSASRGIHLYTHIDRNRCAGCGVARISPFFSTLEWQDNAGDSIYNGGSLVVRHILQRGLSFQAAYTIGKGIDSMSGGSGTGGQYGDVYDAWNLRIQRGLGSQDVPQRLALSYVWSIPAPATSNRLVRGITKGWEVSGITILQKGLPQTVTTGNADYNNDALFLDVPDAPATTFPGWSRSDYINGTFKVTDFPAPPKDPVTGQFLREGNLGRNTFRGPGLAQVDFSGIKNTKIPWFTTEGAQMQLRFEFFNILNRVNLASWGTSLSSPGTFGKATSARDPRTLQLGLRIAF